MRRDGLSVQAGAPLGLQIFSQLYLWHCCQQMLLLYLLVRLFSVIHHWPAYRAWPCCFCSGYFFLHQSLFCCWFLVSSSLFIPSILYSHLFPSDLLALY